MKFYLILSLSLISLSLAFAGNPPKKAVSDPEQKIKVTTYSKDYPIEKLKGDQYQQQNFDKKDPKGILPPAERDALFGKAGLTQATEKWDQLDKDMLLMKARTASLVDLQKKYPKLSKEALQKLQNLLK